MEKLDVRKSGSERLNTGNKPDGPRLTNSIYGAWAWAPGFALQADSLIGSSPICSTKFMGSSVAGHELVC